MPRRKQKLQTRPIEIEIPNHKEPNIILISPYGKNASNAIYQCTRCGHKSETLKRHKRHATSHFRYTCWICLAKFNSTKRLNRHSNYKHFTRVFHCDFCACHFRLEEELKTHLVINHNRESVKKKAYDMLTPKIERTSCIFDRIALTEDRKQFEPADRSIYRQCRKNKNVNQKACLSEDVQAVTLLENTKTCSSSETATPSDCVEVVDISDD